MESINKSHDLYDRMRYSWRQIKDCVDGTVAVKLAGEVYLPMPAGMLSVQVSASLSNQNSRSQAVSDYQTQYLPWWHPNPAYRAYLQRARFPDITANTLRGLVGVATRNAPQYELPSTLEYMEESATIDGRGLDELYGLCIMDDLKFGRVPLVLDIGKDELLRIIKYSTADMIYWREGLVNGIRQLVEVVFRERSDAADVEKHLRYFLQQEGDAAAVAMVEPYVNGIPGEAVALNYKGKTLSRLPIACIGSVSNSPDPDIIPLLGISDVALAIYREDADAANARYLTCNPTLFITGIESSETPKTMGSSVIIGIANPAAKAFYPATDTSALEHIRSHIQDLFNEAIQYGSHFLGASKAGQESGDALRLRQAASGATLIHIVNLVSTGLEDLLNIASDWMGAGSKIEFEGSTEFAEVAMSAQDITALVTSWMNGGISHDTLLDNLRDSGIVSDEVTNEEEKGKIEIEKPAVPVQGNFGGGGGNFT